MIAERYRSFLIDELHADKVPHGQRSLYAHLVGTYQILKSWGCSDQVCLGGLFHSIYGTVQFRRATLPFNQRGRVRKLIGLEAELLAYLFCVTDRPLGLIEQWGRPDIVIPDRHLLDFVVLNRQELLWLLEIEAANLLEQDVKSDRYIRRLDRIPISAAANAALRRYIEASARREAAVRREEPSLQAGV